MLPNYHTCLKTDGALQLNTALQLLLMGVTTVSPLITADIGTALYALQ